MAPARILLVEDDDALRETLAEVLGDEGYQVACARDGRDALQQLSRGAVPDLIVLDLMMPVMDGWAFREAQRRSPRLADIPMVVLSASFPPDPARLRALDAQAVLAKPVGIDRLVEALQRLVRPAPALGLAH